MQRIDLNSKIREHFMSANKFMREAGFADAPCCPLAAAVLLHQCHSLCCPCRFFLSTADGWSLALTVP
jgi:hypothetical protein